MFYCFPLLLLISLLKLISMHPPLSLFANLCLTPCVKRGRVGGWETEVKGGKCTAGGWWRTHRVGKTRRDVHRLNVTRVGQHRLQHRYTQVQGVSEPCVGCSTVDEQGEKYSELRAARGMCV